ncbi:GNAT family N-acetyltransferase [Gallaecimonas kandeliae]|uniref:GNAT family N-acetyltransferase n=1 Tax=Gallaecimonas kandeliae TaxID=3029055 RepID=UPI0026487B23|nr:GNAT family N-acetyltransferase [Gallaecimonas kandeliae]WKE64037.1 GNAT family N-acetyltransferase [Gallaecimonas kandeliae]
MNQREIVTERLLLRRFVISDAKRVQSLAGNKEVANTTASIPYPYPDGLAEKWIATHEDNFANRATVTYAVTLKDSSDLIGCVSMLNLNSGQPELGYWIGVDYWGKGFCTEACRAFIDHCIEAFGFKAIYGKHLAINPASGRVMEKCGLTYMSTEKGKTGFMKDAEELRIYKLVCA